jgi:hypothetical protein
MPRPALIGLALCLFSTSLLVAETPLKTIRVGEKPESVCRGFGGKLYVSIINGEVPGDGTIVAVDGETVTVFAKGFSNPKGLVFVGDYLVTADETTLWKVDKDGTATKLAEAKAFPQPIEFLNDVAAGKDGTCVYVAETSTPSPMFDPNGDRKLWPLDSEEAKQLPNKGCVYKVTLKGEISVAVPAGNPALRFPNGVAVSEVQGPDRIYVGDFFTGDIVNYRSGKYHVVISGLRGIDGITVTEDYFYASSWTQGKVWQVNRKTKEPKIMLEGLQSAADFFYDRDNKQLIVPDMLAGTLTFLPIE